MLIGVRTSMLDELRSCAVMLYLTGSRFFLYSQVRPDSDWDFYCEYNPHNAEVLRRLGFQVERPAALVDDISYTDANCATVLVHERDGVKFHIQMVRKISLKTEMQEFLKRFPWQAVPKDQRRLIWDWAQVQVTTKRHYTMTKG